jgi:predicted AlkP superfamily phosphohydrolase/phosphomutase
MGASLIIVGIDGGTFELAAPWAREGDLPNLSGLMQEGCWGDLVSVYPPITAAAWSSFMTGCNPGKHGVFDFLVRDPDCEDIIDARSIAQPTLWQILSSVDMRVGSVNVPVTFPPAPLNGVMITGGLSPTDPDRSAWPAGLIQQLEATTGRRWWQHDRKSYRPSDPTEFLAAMERSNTTIAAFAAHLLQEQEFDVFMVVLNMVDGISHFFWHYMDETHPAHERCAPILGDAVKHAYQTADRLLGRLIGAAGPEADAFVVSDHGFGPVTRMVNLNNFLIERGYMTLKRSVSAHLKQAARGIGFTPANVMRTLELMRLDGLVSRVSRAVRNRVIGAMGSYADVDWDHTVCYSRGHLGQIYFTPGVKADPAKFASVRDRLVRDLRDHLRAPDTGENLVTEILFGDEIYHGPFAERGPDIYLIMDDWRTIAYPLLSSGPGLIVPGIQRNRWANHRMNGMFCACGPSIRATGHLNECRIVDIAPTVLSLQGVRVPAYMDGRVLTEAVITPPAEAYVDATLTSEAGLREPRRTASLTDQEKREQRERLRGLGYL